MDNMSSLENKTKSSELKYFMSSKHTFVTSNKEKMALPINIESLLSGSAVESNQLEYIVASVPLLMILRIQVVGILL